MEDSYAASGDAFVAGAYDEKLVPIAQTNGPNSRGEGISLKEQHFCVAERKYFNQCDFSIFSLKIPCD
jgi:hypothetical protein